MLRILFAGVGLVCFWHYSICRYFLVSVLYCSWMVVYLIDFSWLFCVTFTCVGWFVFWFTLFDFVCLGLCWVWVCLFWCVCVWFVVFALTVLVFIFEFLWLSGFALWLGFWVFALPTCCLFLFEFNLLWFGVSLALGLLALLEWLLVKLVYCGNLIFIMFWIRGDWICVVLFGFIMGCFELRLNLFGTLLLVMFAAWVALVLLMWVWCCWFMVMFEMMLNLSFWCCYYVCC